jgi:hypothetical protein
MYRVKKQTQTGATMNTATLDPRVSEFETEEQASSYDQWFRAKVQEAIDDKRPRIPHDQVAQRMEKILFEIRQKKAA